VLTVSSFVQALFIPYTVTESFLLMGLHIRSNSALKDWYFLIIVFCDINDKFDLGKIYLQEVEELLHGEF
jgi:hypothetical protein